MQSEWKHHDEDWLICYEQLVPNRWLLCFRKWSNNKDLPDAWVNVTSEPWPQHNRMISTVEEYMLQACGPLEVECIMIEMRKKYGADDGTL